MGARVVNRCPECRGVWLTQAQLAEILDEVADPDTVGKESTVEFDGQADIGHTFAPSRKARTCPVCQTDMMNYKFEDSGIWIDGCPSHGLWLDNGELRLLAQRRGKASPGVEEDGEVLDALSDLIAGTL